MAVFGGRIGRIGFMTFVAANAVAGVRAFFPGFDEFDLAQKSDHVLGVCFEIIDMRYRTDMPILITTNTMPKAIVTERSMIKRKIYDRIRTCEVAVIEGQSRRR